MHDSKRLKRILLDDKMEDGGTLQYCKSCDWDSGKTGGARIANCPECNTETTSLRLTNEVIRVICGQ